MKNSVRLMVATLTMTSALATTPALARTLNIGAIGELASFDTSQVSGGTWESDILMDVYEGLVKENPSGKLLPGMATSWETSDDGLTWTFHMRDGAKWSDGTPVTADDFVFGWRHLLNPANASKYAYNLYPIKNAEAVSTGKQPLDALGVASRDNGKTLEVTLNQPTPYFLQLMAHYTAFPQPKHLVEKYGKDWTGMEHIATNGAFHPVQWVSQSRITTEKNPAYYDVSQVALDGVNYFTSEDRNAGISRFRSGQFDVLREYPSNRYQWLKENLPDATHMSPMLGNYYYVFNQRKGEPTADPRVREALNLAIRRDVLAKQIMGGTFLPAYAFVPPGVNNYTRQPLAFKGEPMAERMKRARALMKDAGYGPDHPLTLNLRYNSSDEHKKIAIAVAAMWKPLGVKTQLQQAEATVHYQAIAEGDFNVARAAWIADYDDAENFLSLLSTGAGNNYGAYSSPAFDADMKKAANTADPAAREKLLEHAEAIAMQDNAVAPLLFYVTRNLVNPDLEGWEDNVKDNHPSRWVSFKE
ncbi:peptide ABC transporter substrate-binding protein [Larsenimonas rhizosphaerae]|uniref:peptide ABC transporter substrate-binding protein n=1 Tax=Larsenimonas rhizosphaerae TaxID=2944682 RepID=UPI00203410C1|nr:peptide ABC transporter substrate-binding protein [Larsenimonas rhizosphaerae]MCM2131661.1 peptide ABC transporter substrate-binding protein [Larsenimonas rhizosphaerae]